MGTLVVTFREALTDHDSYSQRLPDLELAIERATERTPDGSRYYVFRGEEIMGAFRRLADAQARSREVRDSSGWKPPERESDPVARLEREKAAHERYRQMEHWQRVSSRKGWFKRPPRLAAGCTKPSVESCRLSSPTGARQSGARPLPGQVAATTTTLVSSRPLILRHRGSIRPQHRSVEDELGDDGGRTYLADRKVRRAARRATGCVDRSRVGG